MPALRDPNRKGVAGSFTNAVGGRRHIARAVDGISHVDGRLSALPLSSRIAFFPLKFIGVDPLIVTVPGDRVLGLR